jgi:hypothetical protein
MKQELLAAYCHLNPFRTPSHTISLRYILILLAHIRLCSPSCLLPSGYAIKILCVILDTFSFMSLVVYSYFEKSCET